jgi:hypothetical protein
MEAAKYKSKIDVSHAYLHFKLNEEAQKVVVINTHRGLYKFLRLPFGVNMAVEMFQHAMKQLLHDLDGIECYLDDILVTGSTKEEHDRRLRAVLRRLHGKGFCLRKQKCIFGVVKLPFLRVLLTEGRKPLPNRIDAIANAPLPDSKEKLLNFIGILTYYSEFIPHFSTIAAPLYKLTHKDAEWNWTEQYQIAFNKLRASHTNDTLLVHYQSSLPIGLDCDASSHGLGCVMYHQMPDGSQHPIAYASKTLSNAERSYSQIEREALSLLFGVRKFHQFLFGRKFTLVTDHKPLLVVLGPKGHIQTVSASRLHRWATELLAYDFELQFRPTEAHANADFLSRNPLSVVDDFCL